MLDDLSPALGGGPAEWPHKQTPDHTFIPPWRRAEMIDEANRELARIEQDHAARIAEIRRIQEQTDAMVAAFTFDRSHASSGRAIEARHRSQFERMRGWMGN